MTETSISPGGVAFDSLSVYSDVLLVDLPATGKLRLEDARYLGFIADAMGLTGVNLSVGAFCTFISTEAYRQFRDGVINWREYVAKWSR